MASAARSAPSVGSTLEGGGGGGGEDFDFPRFGEYAGLGYKWGATVAEESGHKLTQSWSVAFCLRPSGYHVRGPAEYWRKEWTQPQKDVDPLDLPAFKENDWKMLFATVNERTLRMYTTGSGKAPKCVHKHTFPLGEQLYCVTYVYNADGAKSWWIICAGASRVVWIIDAVTKEPVRQLLAHGEAIYDAQVHPRDPSLLITASKDESLRLWNLRTGAQIAMFAGLKGHHGEVVSADWDRFGHRFASCSIDNSIRIWNFASDEVITDAILESHKAADRGVDNHGYYVDEDGQRKKTTVVVSQEPAFICRKIHKHYVDSVAWIGEALLTKSLHNMLYLWIPGSDRLSLASESQDYTLLQEYPVKGADVWFIRFGMCIRKQTLAVGGKNGIVTVFYLKEFTPKPIVLKPAGKKLADDVYIRKCAFSDCSEVIIAVGDDAKVYQYDRSDASAPTPQKQLRRRKKTTKRTSSEISPMEVDEGAPNTPMRDVGNTNSSRRSNGVCSSPRNRNKNNSNNSPGTPASPPVEVETATRKEDQGSSSTGNGNGNSAAVVYDRDDVISTATDSETELGRRARDGLAAVAVTASTTAGSNANNMELDRVKSPVAGQDADEDEIEEVPVTPRRPSTTPPRQAVSAIAPPRGAVSAIAPPTSRPTVSAIAPPPRPQPTQDTEEDDNDDAVVAVKEEMRTRRKDDDDDKEPPEIIEISD